MEWTKAFGPPVWNDVSCRSTAMSNLQDEVGAKADDNLARLHSLAALIIAERGFILMEKGVKVNCYCFLCTALGFCGVSWSFFQITNITSGIIRQVFSVALTTPTVKRTLGHKMHDPFGFYKMDD